MLSKGSEETNVSLNNQLWKVLSDRSVINESNQTGALFTDNLQLDIEKSIMGRVSGFVNVQKAMWAHASLNFLSLNGSHLREAANICAQIKIV